MEKIAVALQRKLRDEFSEESPFLGVDERGPAQALPVRVPGKIQYTQTRVVQIAPAVLEQHRVAAVSNDPTADAFRMLRTQVLMQMRRNGWQTLAITSPNKGAGKSTVALNLAISFAMEVDHTALLVDADLRDPDLRNMLALDTGPGLADYLVGTAPIPDLLIHPGIGNLVILPGGAAVANTSELMRSPMMAGLVEELRARYADRFVVFDVPPILQGADTLALSGYMDATILLVEEAKTSRDDLERALELLSKSNLIGVVLNKSRELPKPDPIKWPAAGLLRRIFGSER